ncbi:DUF4350 domain-containing protein [Planomonospora sp. ID67723]|uniref:DUF4350 domain-containing protein n=1 Tax=Planomonospora sp. ID67723 TaxID=2738134 RepID=UPI0018C400A8|nr:DUF4350 domain-containing protein [Planomonospora sp. ID67723]MBG0828070.1 DUF4350 domain-containing protein [Planomonospora sp. ID67723]
MTAESSVSVPAPASAPTSPRAQDLWRRWRGVLGVLAFMIVLAAVTVLVSRPRPGGYLDPEATTPAGAHALAQLLRDQGVEIRPARSVDEARELAAPESLLLVTRTEFLAAGWLMDDLATLPGDRLLVEPVTEALQALAPGVSAGALTDVEPRAPGCTLPAAVKAGGAVTGGVSYNPPPGASSCYGGGLIGYTDGGRTVTVLGSGEFMTNRRLAEEGDAALAMNLAGSRPVVVWLAPTFPQAGPADGETSFADLVPAGVKWAAVQLLVAVVLVAFWRARRLGPVVAERLPVVVRAAETVEGRGRLYRSHGARDRAAAALRAAALDRIVPRLGLAGDVTPAGVVAAVAMRTGQDAQQAGAVLYGAAPGDDAGLVALARHLDTLERQVRDS